MESDQGAIPLIEAKLRLSTSGGLSDTITKLLSARRLHTS
jgi:hypothetical protein